MKNWVISYKHRRGGELYVVEVHSIAGMLWWLLRKAASCKVFVVSKVEE